MKIERLTRRWEHFEQNWVFANTRSLKLNTKRSLPLVFFLVLFVVGKSGSFRQHFTNLMKKQIETKKMYLDFHNFISSCGRLEMQQEDNGAFQYDVGELKSFKLIIKLFVQTKPMIKTRKYLRFEQMRIELNSNHPKEVSRAVLCFRDEDGNVFKTSKYGEVTDTSIEWDSAVEILYTNQEVFNLQTHCEHEFGYEINELESLYNGQVYIKTQNFFRPLNVHIFNAETGEKCGIMKYIIKIVEKEIEKTASKPTTAKQEVTVKVDLIAKISFYAASMTVNTPIFKKQKYATDLQLLVQICGHKVEATYKKNFQWTFQSSEKIQYMENSPEQINIYLKQDNSLILAGQTNLQTLKNNKRFVTHSIGLIDKNQNKIATLALDLRYVTKQEVLDLMYSPTKLSGPGPKKSAQQKLSDISKSRISKYQKMRANSSALATSRKEQELRDIAKASHSVLPQEGRSMNRYKKVLMNNSNEIIIPRAKRFADQAKVCPYVSYSDPQKFSDFYSPRQVGPIRGYDMSLGKKSDFTKQYKHNPGVGSYKLPSIWDKY